MPSNKCFHTPSLAILTVIVCSAGSLVGGCLGNFAANFPDYGWAWIGYHVETIHVAYVVGTWIGAVSGLIGGLTWCRIMIPKAIRHGPRRLVTQGALYGLIVGVCSTIILHTCLMITASKLSPMGMIIGLLFGIPSGLLVGALCGLACRRLVHSVWANHTVNQTGNEP